MQSIFLRVLMRRIKAIPLFCGIHSALQKETTCDIGGPLFSMALDIIPTLSSPWHNLRSSDSDQLFTT